MVLDDIHFHMTSVLQYRTSHVIGASAEMPCNIDWYYCNQTSCNSVIIFRFLFRSPRMHLAKYNKLAWSWCRIYDAVMTNVKLPTLQHSLGNKTQQMLTIKITLEPG